LISRSSIQKVYDAIDIVDVISDFVQLKKSGSSYKGLSPFVQEKTPSFMVSPQKQIFKDFSSGKGGDTVSFIMEHEGLSYPEAIRYLAQKYGIELEEDNVVSVEKESSTERESLMIVLNYAKNLFQKNLLDTEEGKSVGLSYFKERGYTLETIKEFGLGYSINEWDILLKDATQNQYKEELLEKAGLIIKKENKAYDRFRGRVMFPIHSINGSVIAFGARILTNDKNQPKYLNSPETEVYHKSDIVYGIAQAKNHIRSENNCYLVEGYTDVLTLHQAGIRNTVASSGTALTVEQIKLIKRYSTNVTVIFDGDAAGIRASIRGINLLLEEVIHVKVILIPEGDDPDGYCKKLGSVGFKNYITEQAQDFLTFKTEFIFKDVKTDPYKKAEAIIDIVESIAKIPSGIQRAVYFQECSRLLEIEEQVLISEYNKIVLKQRKGSAKVDQLEPQQVIVEEKKVEPVQNLIDVTLFNQEKEIVRLLLNYGHIDLPEGFLVADYLLRETKEIEYQHPPFQTIISYYKSCVEEKKIPDYNDLLQTDNQDVKSLVSELLTNRFEISFKWEEFDIFPKREQDFLDKVAYETILRLKWRNIKKMRNDKMEELKQNLSIEDIMIVQKQLMKLKQLEMSIAQILGNVTSGM